MKALLAALLLFGSCGPAIAGGDNPLVGRWQFYKKIYQGKDIPEGPGATLRLFYEFTADGESHLWWWHEGDGDHCNRKGRYSLDNGFLVEEVTWVDPTNTRDCASDPDMQPNKRTRTPYLFHGEDFAIQFHLGDENIDFVWKRIPVKEED